jgi:uncharacterized protein YjiS (DUF1127 family)
MQQPRWHDTPDTVRRPIDHAAAPQRAGQLSLIDLVHSTPNRTRIGKRPAGLNRSSTSFPRFIRRNNKNRQQRQGRRSGNQLSEHLLRRAQIPAGRATKRC